MSLKVWIKAARLRTLPLALSGIIIGFSVANVLQFSTEWFLFIMILLTAISLQILSNFANDYGDFMKGTDGKERTDRVLSSGDITPEKLKKGIFIFIALSLFFGILSIVISPVKLDLYTIILFLVGCISIAAAYKYTVGKNPYGYNALGDISVFLFFGLFSVIGTYFLMTKGVHHLTFYPAISIGLLSVAVLNTNNIRDIENDLKNNKKTVANTLGKRKALIYHLMLLLLGLSCLFIFEYKRFANPLHYSFLLLSPFYFSHYDRLTKIQNDKREEYNKELKTLSLLILITALVFAVSHQF